VFPSSFDKAVRPSAAACSQRSALTLFQASVRQSKLQAGLYMIYVSIPNATGLSLPLVFLSPTPSPRFRHRFFPPTMQMQAYSETFQPRFG
jgi:hypothetical protein